MDLSELAAAPPAHRHPWEIARLWVLRRFIREHMPIRDGDAIVDVGCGDAFVIGELARNFPSASFFGIDAALTPDAIASRATTLPANVHLAQDFDGLPHLDRPAALILLMDVIEHIEGDREFVTALVGKPIVGPDTRFFVTVPAFQGLFSSHDVFLRHFRRYSNAELRDSLERAGLRVVDIGYFFTSLLAPRVAQVAREKLAPRKKPRERTRLSTYSGGRVRTSLFSALLIGDAFISLLFKKIGVRVPGLSNFAICRTSV